MVDAIDMYNRTWNLNNNNEYRFDSQYDFPLKIYSFQ